jgi:NADPH-dependent glutamate synthase beta subunit-like oxidoreductase
VLDLPNGLARGVRAASDFLMALQLTGRGQEGLHRQPADPPAGGGDRRRPDRDRHRDRIARLLSAAGREVPGAARDAGAERGEAAVGAAWNDEEREIAREFLGHAKAIRAERAQAARENREPDIAKLVNGWGGVSLVYRRRLIDSPSYTLNHEEVLKALEEDIRFVEGLSPVAVEVDANGHAKALKVAGEQNGAKIEATLPARTILVAAGTQPNTVLAREDATHAFIDGKYFRALTRRAIPPRRSATANPPRCAC